MSSDSEAGLVRLALAVIDGDATRHTCKVCKRPYVTRGRDDEVQVDRFVGWGGWTNLNGCPNCNPDFTPFAAQMRDLGLWSYTDGDSD